MPKDLDSLLEAMERAVAGSPKAKARWDAMPGEALQPLVDWVCKPTFTFVARRRIREAVHVLERTPLEEVGGLRSIDLLSPPGITGPSILDAIFRR